MASASPPGTGRRGAAHEHSFIVLPAAVNYVGMGDERFPADEEFLHEPPSPPRVAPAPPLQDRPAPGGSLRCAMVGDAASVRWNHNIHYHSLVLRALPPTSRRVLDVGCGEGMLTRELRRLAHDVVGIDLHEPSINLARDQSTADGIVYVLGDFLTFPFEPESFDIIVSVATLHHMDASAALVQMRSLLCPGGRLVVIGLARSRGPLDLACDIAGVFGDLLYKRVRTYWDHSAPTVWPPPLTYGQTRRIAIRELPGVRYRRHLLFRHSLVWTKPGG